MQCWTTTPNDSFFPVLSYCLRLLSSIPLLSSVCLFMCCLFARQLCVLLQDWSRYNSRHHLCRYFVDPYHCHCHLPLCQLSASEDRKWWGNVAKMSHVFVAFTVLCITIKAFEMKRFIRDKCLLSQKPLRNTNLFLIQFNAQLLFLKLLTIMLFYFVFFVSLVGPLSFISIIASLSLPC